MCQDFTYSKNGDDECVVCEECKRCDFITGICSSCEYGEKKLNLDATECVSCSNNDNCFEIFGITLHFDDILIICLLFFLYNEGVKDQLLFISLIMLLLS
jgi:hypothetical protein